jgi:hypothetical protein
MDTQLLCTFSTPDLLGDALQEIQEFYNIVYSYIYVLQNTDNDDELFITYNIESGINIKSHLPNTILVHRKKDTNTIYTINALNNLIIQQNNGILNTRYQLNWELYRNSIILTNAISTKQINTKIYKVIKFSD